MRLLVLGVVFLGITMSTHAQTFLGSKLGNGLRFTAADSSFSTQINLRFQSRYSGVVNLDDNSYTDNFLIRRYRIKFKGFIYDPTIQYKIELGLSNRDQGNFYNENSGAANIVLDAVLKWEFKEGWVLWAGQTKLPGNRERVISSGAMQFTERSELNAFYNLDRDMGLQLHHEHEIGDWVVREIGSISMGEGRNVTASNIQGYDYTARIEFLPFGKFKKKGDYFGGDLMREPKPKLSVGITYDFNDNNNRERGQLGRFLDTHVDISSWYADLMFKYHGFSIMSEYANRRIANGPAFGLDELGSQRYFYMGEAFNFSTGYLFKNNIEIAGRYVINRPKSVDISPDSEIITLNLSKYISGHTLKLQSSASYIQNHGGANELLFMCQAEIGF
ncbi:hypothetical protein BFP72_06465 [Reichenbachiella sp. 5M10]|uniref:porin n=1 Tax=Reichenbachiella sp. 5M10 TaxID=1889772 RepID=UPI000C1609EC|nr:porin [Reichenbachiella sp. 5M10]PIB35064.1 hypothetical protein BFP72_06465 [Reichenbachiella sp. 5M10]